MNAPVTAARDTQQLVNVDPRKARTIKRVLKKHRNIRRSRQKSHFGLGRRRYR